MSFQPHEMPSFSDVKYVYNPETLKMMGAAFDTSWQSFPPGLKHHEGARRKLALLILRHMDRGERGSAIYAAADRPRPVPVTDDKHPTVAGMVRQIAVTFILLKLFSLLYVRERFAKALARHSPRPQTAHGVT
jgi:hypothetical protein